MHLLLGLVFFASASFPQSFSDQVSALGAALEQPGEQELEACERAEIENELFIAWQAASEEQRQRAAEVLASLRSVGAPSEWRPDLGSIGVATRVLGGDDPERWLGEGAAAVLGVQAMSVHLAVQPGVFAVTEAGRRSASMTVEVRPAFRLRDRLDVTARLLWIAPDGTETLAREEPVAKEAFSGKGHGAFNMYVRAPEGPPGLWNLVLEIEPTFVFTDGSTDDATVGALLLRPVRSRPVGVPCLGTIDQLPAEPLTVGEQLLMERGIVIPPYIDSLGSEWLADLADGLVTGPGGGPGSHPKPESISSRVWNIDLVWAAPSAIATGPCLAGEVGRRWRNEVPARITVLRDLDPSGASGSIHRALTSLVVDRKPNTTRVLVLDGDALIGAQLEALISGPFDIDALVVIANRWRPTATLPAVPTLFLTANRDVAALAERLGKGRVEAEALGHSVFLSSMLVPGRIGAFLERHSFGTTEAADQ